MIVVLGVGLALLAIVVAYGLDNIRKEAALSANAQSHMAEALGKIADHLVAIKDRQRVIHDEMLKLSAKASRIKNEEINREIEEARAKGTLRVFDD